MVCDALIVLLSSTPMEWQEYGASSSRDANSRVDQTCPRSKFKKTKSISFYMMVGNKIKRISMFQQKGSNVLILIPT